MQVIAGCEKGQRAILLTIWRHWRERGDVWMLCTRARRATATATYRLLEASMTAEC